MSTPPGTMPSSTRDLRILLASASPRRRELLARTGWLVSHVSIQVDERWEAGETAIALAKRLARAKAEGVDDHQRVVLSADTIVVDGGHVLGKPINAGEAEEMLRRLRNRSHEVITALVLQDRSSGREETECCETHVPMRSYSDEEIDAYVRSGSAADKAGAYGIQDGRFSPVDMSQFDGCYANVMGLPLCHLTRAMTRLGFHAHTDIPLACQGFTGYTCPIYERILRGEI